jgi:heat shock protein HtpX
MAKYIGIQAQIRRNNRKSFFLLLGFPLLILGLVYVISFVVGASETAQATTDEINEVFFRIAPWVILAVAIWFLIAYKSHNAMINASVHAKSLDRKNNMRVYNLVENLCMSVGMTMPKVQIIEDQALNAFASGLNEKSYTVTLTRGLIEKLNDDELEGVIAHELLHIRNRDVRLLVITIIFVGIFSFLVQVLFRNMLYGGGRRGNSKDNKGMILILIAAFVAYLLSMVFKFSLSRKREYMADAGAAEMTKKPWALASALRKISGNSQLQDVTSSDVKELFIDNYPEKEKGFAASLSGIFATHPPIKKRIQALENF